MFSGFPENQGNLARVEMFKILVVTNLNLPCEILIQEKISHNTYSHSLLLSREEHLSFRAQISRVYQE